jgi:hypothetical protein
MFTKIVVSDPVSEITVTGTISKYFDTVELHYHYPTARMYSVIYVPAMFEQSMTDDYLIKKIYHLADMPVSEEIPF